VIENKTPWKHRGVFNNSSSKNRTNQNKDSFSGVLRSILVEIWRLKNRLNTINNTGVDLTKIYEEIERIDDVLVNEDIKICDYTGKKYEKGMSVNVLYAYKDENGQEENKIITETIRPTITYKKEIFLLGEVIVGKK